MDARTPDPRLVARCARMLGRPLIAWRPVDRGYTAAERWLARTPDGLGLFVKAATNEATARDLRTEGRLYGGLRGEFHPHVFAFCDEAPWPVLVLEDLSDAHWPPPWSPEHVTAVRRTLAEVAACEPPPGLADAETLYRESFSGWKLIAVDPAPFLALGLASAAWLERALPTLTQAEQDARLAGPSLLHQDVRSDNLCLRGDRALLVDWNWACRGNPLLDLACWAPSLAYEGGPRPDDLLPGEPALAAAVSGYFASQAGLPVGPAPERVRRLQRRQLEEALPWAVRALGLPVPA